jgi:hypothetical protein
VTLDPRPSDELLIRRYKEQTGIRIAPGSPMLAQLRRQDAAARGRPVATGDPLDPQGRMNKWERLRAGELEVLRRCDAIDSWQFEAIALILADRTRYHPDFVIYEKDGGLTFEEVKGFMRDDAAVKIKVAARQFPHFRFKLFRKRKGNRPGTSARCRHDQASARNGRDGCGGAALHDRLPEEPGAHLPSVGEASHEGGVGKPWRAVGANADAEHQLHRWLRLAWLRSKRASSQPAFRRGVVSVHLPIVQSADDRWHSARDLAGASSGSGEGQAQDRVRCPRPVPRV